jgi:hypothetical protein
MTTIVSPPPSRTPLPIKALAKQILDRTPRESAKSEIEMSFVALRTCYEACMRLVGPREAVLDYAAALFADAAAHPGHTPALALEEAHSEAGGETLSLLLSRGMYSAE